MTLLSRLWSGFMRRFVISLLSSLALVVGLLGLASSPVQAVQAESSVSVASVPKGKISAVKLLGRLKVRAEKKAWSYDRKEFKHWTSIKGCDTRHSLLKTESKTKPKVAKGCKVTSGRWVDEYTKKTFTKPSQVEIDHRVALAEAWRSGAHKWGSRKLEGFANDLEYKHSLLAVQSKVNQSKSDHDPSAWMPAVNECKYVSRWVAVKARWKLTIDHAERNSIVATMNTCRPRQLMVERPGKGKLAPKPAPKKKAAPKAPSTGGGGSAAPRGWDCPSSHPIKGNASSMIYHMPGGAYYSRTNPEECFATESAARAAGYRKSMR